MLVLLLLLFLLLFVELRVGRDVPRGSPEDPEVNQNLAMPADHALSQAHTPAEALIVCVIFLYPHPTLFLTVLVT